MNVLLANKYLYKFGGPEVLMFETAALLERHGHSVSFFGMAEQAEVPDRFKPYLAPSVDYDQLNRGAGWRAKAQTAINLIYSRAAARCIQDLIEAFPPDIAHFRNIYHQLSPSILPAVQQRGIPIVLSVHDYKLVCPNYRLYTHDGVCRRCVPGQYYHAVKHRCVKNSRALSALSAIEMYTHHVLWPVYRKTADVFITENHFMRGLLIEAGFDVQKIRVLPNFVNVADYAPQYSAGNYLLYFGRLVPEKGVATLIEAVRLLPIKLVIVGDGPHRAELEALVITQSIANVSFVGAKWGTELAEWVKGARAVIVPSEWWENSPMVIYQSFAWGKPVIGSQVGGIIDLITDGVDGFTFEAGQVDDLRDKILRLIFDAEMAVSFGRQARLKAEREFAPEVYYERLMTIYDQARIRAL